MKGGNDKNEKKNFYYKSPKAHCYHFVTFYLTGVSNKNITDTHNLLWVSKPKIWGRHSLAKPNVPLFLFYAIQIAYIQIIS